MPSPIAKARAGFSLIEATVMLAIAGMALMLIFAVATRASDQGFRLGRLALGAADAEVADDAFRSLVGGLALQPSPPQPGQLGAPSFAGTPDGFEGPVILGRGGPCAAAGPTARIQVQIQHAADRDRIVCRGGQAVLMELKGRAAFAYSEDGRSWAQTYTDRPTFGFQAADAVAGVQRRSRRLYVRLATRDGGFDIVAVSARDRPGEAAPPPSRTGAPL